MFPRLPPLAYARVGKKITHGSLDLAPQRWSEDAVAEREIHPLEVMEEAILKRAKSKFGRSIQIAERLYAAKVKRAELTAFMQGPREIAPLGSQSVHRRLASLLSLISDLDCEINERRDSDKHRCQLPNCGKHFPVHDDGIGLTRIIRQLVVYFCVFPRKAPKKATNDKPQFTVMPPVQGGSFFACVSAVT